MTDAVETTTTGTPLPPSVEKAYYRKCIELKRRLNEVQAANDEYRIRRVRLDRAILKMRLERAFLLDELRKRMEPVGRERRTHRQPAGDENDDDKMSMNGAEGERESCIPQ